MTNRKNILVMAHSRTEIREKLLDAFGQQCCFQFAETPDSVTIKQLQMADAIIGEPDEAQLANATHLQWLQLTWAGADRYTQMTGFPDRVTLTNASGAFGTIIAEYVIGAILSLYRGLPVYWENQQKHLWKKQDADETIYGKNALILGAGDLGRTIAGRLKAFGAYTVGIRKRPECPDAFDEIHPIRELDSLLPEADLLIGCLPGTPETAGLLGRARLQRMKADALLVNVGRGSLLHTADLAEVLAGGHLRGAILDVTEIEPLPESSPLWDLKNVLLTPHIAGPSFARNTGTQAWIWEICMDNLRRYLAGAPLSHVVNRQAGY